MKIAYPPYPVDSTPIGQAWTRAVDLWMQKVGVDSWDEFMVWAMENANFKRYPEKPEDLDIGEWTTIRIALQAWEPEGVFHE